jgi:hypothetical protein
MLSLGGIENLERHERKSVYGCYPEKSLNIKKKDEVFPSNDKIFFVFIRQEEEIKVNTDHIILQSLFNFILTCVDLFITP